MKFALKLILFLLFLGQLNAEIDLEEMAQGFVLEAKRIEIPGYPHAFNPSIIRWHGEYIMSFRVIVNSHLIHHNGISSAAYSVISLVKLDENFCPINAPQILDLNGNSVISRAEDARLVTSGDKFYIVYSDNTNEVCTEGGFRIYIGELEMDGGLFELRRSECLSKFDCEEPGRREKNWVPFDYKGNLMMAYSIEPHLILQTLRGSAACETVAKTSGEISWEWGELRGGTPALLDGTQYLAFFHSSNIMPSVHSDGVKTLHYFIGAYTFSSEPPFEITQISPEPIVGHGFYRGAVYTPYWKPVRVVFPCGYIMDGGYIWIAYGRQDHEIWLVRLDKEALLNSLVPISQQLRFELNSK